MGEFRMPCLGADMETGILAAWLVKPGDRIRRGDIIAEVETHKGVFEVEAYEEGMVTQLLVEPGEEMPVGAVLAVITPEGAAPAREEAVAPKTVPLPKEARIEPAPPVEVGPPPVSTPGRVSASPSARRLAAELGVDLAAVRGTGPRGAVKRADVELAAKEKKAAAPPVPPKEEKPRPADYQAGMRRAIAAAMSRSNREIPHYYLATAIDMTAALRWLEAENAKRSIRDRFLPVVLLLKATALALRDVPELNGYWLEDRHQVREEINMGFAVALRRGGLIAPAIHNVDRLALNDLMAAVNDLIARTRAGKLRGSEVTDATITVTSLGDLGVDTVFGVIYPPQVALVGFGRIGERPWAEKGLLGVRRVVTASLSADHRATDGHSGSLFLQSLNRRLQSPEKL